MKSNIVQIKELRVFEQRPIMLSKMIVLVYLSFVSIGTIDVNLLCLWVP